MYRNIACPVASDDLLVRDDDSSDVKHVVMHAPIIMIHVIRVYNRVRGILQTIMSCDGIMLLILAGFVTIAALTLTCCHYDSIVE